MKMKIATTLVISAVHEAIDPDDEPDYAEYTQQLVVRCVSAPEMREVMYVFATHPVASVNRTKAEVAKWVAIKDILETSLKDLNKKIDEQGGINLTRATPVPQGKVN